MASIRYDIVSRHGGWSIACGGTVGPPYMDRRQALRDATWIAELLERAGDSVEIYVNDQRARAPSSKGMATSTR